MARRLVGIRWKRKGWQAHIEVAAKLYTKQFPISEPVVDMQAWRKRQKDIYDSAAAGSLDSDVTDYPAAGIVAFTVVSGVR